MKIWRTLWLPVCLLLSAPCHAAEPYPSKPIRLVVPFAPSGAIDLLARRLSIEMAHGLGTQVIVENVPGATGNIGTAAVARADADGHTILMGSVGPLAIAQSMQDTLPFDPRNDFAPVAMVANGPLILVTAPGFPAKSVQEVIAYARKFPGTLNYASAGTGSALHLCGELTKSMAKIEMVHIPYKGSSPALLEVVAGRVQIMFSDIVSALPLIKAGRLPALAVTTPVRIASLADIPTVSESGLPGFECGTWYGLLVPAKTPSDVIKQLQTEVSRILKVEPFRQWLIDHGTEPTSMAPKDFAAHIEKDRVKWSLILKPQAKHAN